MTKYKAHILHLEPDPGPRAGGTMLGKQEARVWDLKADPLGSAPDRTWQHQGGDSRAETGWME